MLDGEPPSVQQQLYPAAGARPESSEPNPLKSHGPLPASSARPAPPPQIAPASLRLGEPDKAAGGAMAGSVALSAAGLALVSLGLLLGYQLDAFLPFMAFYILGGGMVGTGVVLFLQKLGQPSRESLVDVRRDGSVEVVTQNWMAASPGRSICTGRFDVGDVAALHVRSGWRVRAHLVVELRSGVCVELCDGNDALKMMSLRRTLARALGMAMDDV